MVHLHMTMTHAAKSTARRAERSIDGGASDMRADASVTKKEGGRGSVRVARIAERA